MSSVGVYPRFPFKEMFSKCGIGAIYTLKENVDLMMDILLSENHIVVHCEEREGKIEEIDFKRI